MSQFRSIYCMKLKIPSSPLQFEFIAPSMHCMIRVEQSRF